MSRSGHPQTLVARQVGNSNALKHGISSPKKMSERAAEFAAEICAVCDFPFSKYPAVEQAARCMAYLTAIDDYLDEHGLVDRKGKPNYLIDKRARFSRELERWWTELVPTIDRHTAGQCSEPSSPEVLTHELWRIATGQDTDATTHDRVSAIRMLRQDQAEKQKNRPHESVTFVFKDMKKEFREQLAAEEAEELARRSGDGAPLEAATDATREPAP
jgi:hypothetical protein